MSCWRAIGSPDINQCLTTLKAFDGCGFKPYLILNSFPMELGGKIVSIDIEVVDAPLDYHLILSRSWFYSMTAVTSSIFRLIQFPHHGQIVTIDHLDFCTPNLRGQHTNNVPFVEGSNISYESVGVGLLKDSSLMGTFPLPTLNPPPKVATVNTISTFLPQSHESIDPWIVPSPIASSLPISQDPIPLSSSSLGEHLATSHHKIQRTKSKGAGVGSEIHIKNLQPLDIMLVIIHPQPVLIMLGQKHPLPAIMMGINWPMDIMPEHRH